MTFDPDPITELPFDGNRTSVLHIFLLVQIALLTICRSVLRIIFKVRAQWASNSAAVILSNAASHLHGYGTRFQNLIRHARRLRSSVTLLRKQEELREECQQSPCSASWHQVRLEVQRCVSQ